MLLSTSPSAAQISYSPQDGGTLTTHRGQLASPSAAKPLLQAPANSNQAAAFAARPVQRPVTVEPVTGPTADHVDLSHRLVEHFAEQMAQQPATIQYLHANHGKLDVQGLWRAIDLVLRHDDAGLRRPLMKALKSIDQNIDEARETFPSHLMTAPGAAAAVNDFADKLKAMQVAMIMLPGAAYDHRINTMEQELTEDAAAGRLDAAKQAKLAVLVEHRGELSRVQYAADHWQAIVKSLMKFEHGLSNLAGADQRPQRLA